MNRIGFLIALSFLALGTIAGVSASQQPTPLYQGGTFGSAFTYQGRLLDGSGNPINGTCVLSATLYTAESGGDQVGSTWVTTTVMSNGYFSIDPDFGPSAWNGDARWLEIAMGCPPKTFPRQAITSVPYAEYSKSVRGFKIGATDVLTVENSGTVVLASGKVGGQKIIGGTSITDVLVLQGTIGNGTTESITIKMLVGNNGSLTAVTILNNGYIGIGTTAPRAPIETISTIGSATPSASNAPIVISDNASQATGTGGALVFSGKFNSSGTFIVGGPFIRAYKDNSISADYGFGLKFGTREDGTGSSAVRITINSIGDVGIGTDNPSSKLQVAGNINPTTTTMKLGSSALWWDEIHYHTLTSHSLGVMDDGILSGTQIISCTDVISALRQSGIVMENGIPHLDYSKLPPILVRPAVDEVVTRTFTDTALLPGSFITVTPVYSDDRISLLWYEYTYTETLHGEIGADLDAFVSVILCAAKELRRKEIALANRQDLIEQRGLALEQRIARIEQILRNHGWLP